MTKVKICGITNLRDARIAASNGADAIGLVFASSPRQVSAKKAQGISRAVGPWVAVVGVFVNEKLVNVLHIIEQCRLSAVQLHGDESASYAKKLSEHTRVIKAFRVGNHFDLRSIKSYDTDAFLFDTKAPDKRGGTGMVFDWSVLKSKKIHRPFIISGGLDPRNVKNVVRDLSPYGVDVSSGVEISPGRKNDELIREFIKNAKETNL